MSFDEQVRAATDRVLAGLRGHVEAELRGYTDAVVRVASAERERLSAEAPASTDALGVEEFVESIRALDASRSLRDVFDRLLDGSTAQADRASILIVEAHRLREWTSRGFAEPLTPAGGLTLEDGGLAGAVVRTGIPAIRPPGPASENRHHEQVFGSSREPYHAVALPLTVSGAVVAVLYAEVSTAGSRRDSTWWPAILEVLARHASRVLEVLTVQQLTRLAPLGPVAQASQVGSPAEQPSRSTP